MKPTFNIIGVVPRLFDSAAVALAVLSGLGLVGGPVAVRVAIAFYALFIVPGRALRRRFFGAPAGAVETAGETFVFGILFAALSVCLGFIPGISYGAISLAAAAGTLALVWLPVRVRPPTGGGEALATESAAPLSSEGPRLISRLLLGVAFAVCLFALYDRCELGSRTDAPDHVSFVRRSVETGVLFPRDSFFREGDGAGPDPRKGLWHPVLARWVHASAAPADRVWRLAPGLIGFFALCVFYGYASSLVGAGFLALLSVALFLVFGAGEGAPWLTKLAFSRNMALLLFWADVHFIIRYCRLRRRSDLVAAALAAAAGAAFHVAFALLAGAALAGMLCFVLVSRDGRAWRAAFARAAPVVLAAAALPLVLRSAETSVAHNMIHVHRQGMLVITETLAVVDPAEVAARFGLVFFFAIVAVPFYYLLAGRLERRGLVFFLFIVPVAIVFVPFTAAPLERSLGYLHYRMLDAAPVAVMLSIVLAGLVRIVFRGTASTAFRRERRASAGVARIVAALGIALFAWYPARIAVRGLATRAAAENRGEDSPRYTALYRALTERLPAHGVIVSDPRTSYLVSAFTDHFVTVTLDQHGSPSDARALERLEETRNLMSPAVPAAESAGWLESVDADYVLVDEEPRSELDFFECMPRGGGCETVKKLESCPSLFAPVFSIEGFMLFKVVGNEAEGRIDSACTGALAGPVDCGDVGGGSGQSAEEAAERLVIENPADVGSGVVLARAVIESFNIRTIDTLTGYFCWRAPRVIPYGLPLELVVRLDGTAPEGRFFRGWYGKQYRRFTERRTRVLYRLTRTELLGSGQSDPDLWRAGETVRQDFSIPIPHAMAPGAYELRIMVRRKPYLPVRSVADYLSNDDSMQGAAIGIVYLQ